MKKVILALLATGLLALPVLAQDYTKHVVAGTVVAAGRDSLVVDTATGRMAFKLDSMLDRVRYDGLQPGTRIEVTHKLDDQSTRQVVTEVALLQSTADATLDRTGSPAVNSVSPDTYAAADARRDQRDTLPATASPFAGLVLLSLIAVFGGLSLRAYSKGTRLGH